MLGRKEYSREYVDACRRKVSEDVRVYEQSVEGTAGCDHRFYNNMALLLDYYFVHRLRGVEGKDGNPLNEVRVIGESILENEGRLVTHASIKLDPGSSVLGLSAGEEIRLSAEDFRALSDAYLSEIESRYV